MNYKIIYKLFYMGYVYYNIFFPFYFVLIQAIVTIIYIEIYIKTFKNKCEYGMWSTYYIPFILTLLRSYIVVGYDTFDDPYYIVTIISYIILIIPLFLTHVFFGYYSSGIFWSPVSSALQPYCKK